MTAKETTLGELGEMLAHVVEHMATKDDLAAVKAELKSDIASVKAELKSDIASVKAELKSDIASLGEQMTSIEQDLKAIRRDLYELSDKVENISGYRKEIDHAFERIAVIEKQLGIAKKIAA